jgi:hypothetical protein
MKEVLMADIFVSYSRQDRPWVMDLATALAGRGWSVWWDREIVVGKSFHHEITNQLSSARCVIVVWSSTSVSSSFVLNEATEGRRRGVLTPIALDAAETPLAFRDLQTADLSDWHPNNPHVEFDRLLRAVTEIAPLTETQTIIAEMNRLLAESEKRQPDMHAMVSWMVDRNGPPLGPTPALAAIVGPGPITRHVATGEVLTHIMLIPPNDPTRGAWIIRGAALRALFGETKGVTMAEVVKVVADNLL